jgi:hypothetical protein
LVLFHAVRRSSFGSIWVIILGASTFVLSQLAKMLFLATFLPEAAESTGLFFQLVRLIVAAADVGAFVAAFRYARGDPRGRVLGLAVGWNFGEIVFRRVAFFWMGAWSAEFSWSYLCAALDSNASLLMIFATVYLVDVWWNSKRGKMERPALYMAVALCSLFPFLLTFLGEWYALLFKFVFGGILTHSAAKDLRLY